MPFSGLAMSQVALELLGLLADGYAEVLTVGLWCDAAEMMPQTRQEFGFVSSVELWYVAGQMAAGACSLACVPRLRED